MDSKPHIVISSRDMERLEALLKVLPANTVPGRRDLQEELDRAEVVAPEKVPHSVVTMNSTVRFVLESSGEEFSLTLVYPKDVKSDGGTISILAPVGSALLGLSIGDSIE
ncbi:MAG TPA: nucleoside diphosphate kinase regulator, partial [Gammaproteobacteria bacterium]|nr:nucleoside diphosphate kinase regulator [Gammaproteobacteria bacterium]